MKNIVKISAFVLGSIIISNINCYAAERVGDVAEAQAVQPLPALSKAQYEAILDKLPAQNMELRLKFLQQAWLDYKEQIKDKIASDDFNKSYDDLPDEAKNIVQTWLQNHEKVWVSEGRKYNEYGDNTLTTGLETLCACARSQSLPQEWQTWFNSLHTISNGCEGCTLTFDLILDILREGLTRLQSKPDDTNVLRVFAELSNLAVRYKWKYAHDVKGLPELVIDTAIAWSINREYNGKDLSLLIKILDKKIEAISHNDRSTSKNQPLIDAKERISSLNTSTFTYATRARLERVLGGAGIDTTDRLTLLKELDENRAVQDVDTEELQEKQKAMERMLNEQIEQEHRELQQQIERQRREANRTPVRKGLRK